MFIRHTLIVSELLALAAGKRKMGTLVAEDVLLGFEELVHVLEVWLTCCQHVDCGFCPSPTCPAFFEVLPLTMMLKG